MRVRERPPMVGRESELAELEAALAGAAAGTTAIEILSGDAGIGKTRLVEELGERARRAGARVLGGSCLDLGDGRIPFAPLTQALRTLSQQSELADLERLLGPARDELARLVPDLARPTPSAVAAAEATGQAGRARLFEAVLGMLERVGREGALLLVVEDVHWIDDATRDLLTFLARNLSHERVLVLITYRSNELPANDAMAGYIGEFQRARIVHRLVLQPLGSAETQTLIAGLLGEIPADDIARSIGERAEGNPLFIEELLAARRSGQRTLPDTLREILLDPVGRLSIPARRVIDVAAVAGRPLDEHVVAPAAELDARSVLTAVREAVAARILVVDGDGYTFRHVLLRDAVLHDLLPAETRRIHERLAETLAAAPASDASSAAELARHWAGAGRPAEALRASLDAAAAAEAVYAFGEALRHYEAGIGLWERTAPDDLPDVTRVELLRGAAEAANLAGEVALATSYTQQALAASEPSEVVVRGLLHGRLGYFSWLSGENEAAIASHREAIRLVPEEPATTERARVLAGLAGALMGAGQYPESSAVARQAITAARAVASPAEEAHGLYILGSDLVSLGDATAGLEYLQRALELSRGGAIDARIVVIHNLAFGLEQADRLEQALQVAAEAIALVRESGLERRFGTSLRAVASECLFRLGRWDEADVITAEGLALRAAPEQALYLLAVRAELLIARGEIDEARQLLDVAGAAMSVGIDPDLQAFIYARQAELALTERRWDGSRAAVARGLAALGDFQVINLTALLHALGIRIEAEHAAEATVRRDTRAAERCRRRAMELAAAAPAALTGDPAGLSASARGWLAAAEAETDGLGGTPVPASWAKVAETWDAIPMPYCAAYARFREAGGWLEAGADRASAALPLRRAAETARGLRAAPLLRAVEGLAQRARIELPAMPDGAAAPEVDPGAARAADRADGPAGGAGASGDTRHGTDQATPLGLSPREVEVLRLLAQGRTNGQIARELFISPKTASVHVTHILVKLGVTNRVEAAMIASRAGLADRLDGQGPG